MTTVIRIDNDLKDKFLLVMSKKFVRTHCKRFLDLVAYEDKHQNLETRCISVEVKGKIEEVS